MSNRMWGLGLVALIGCSGEKGERTIDKIIDDLQLKEDIDSTAPRTCTPGDGRVYVVWQDERQDDDPGDKDPHNAIFFNSSSDAGLTWLPSVIQINNSESHATNPSIACEGDNVYIAWEDTRDGELAYHNVYMDVSDNGGRDFLSDDIRLDADPDGTAMSLGPQVVASEDFVYVAWFDQRNGAYDIYLQASEDRGERWFDEPRRVDSDEIGAAYSANPRLAADGERVVVAWEDRRDGISDIYAARSDNGGGSFDDDQRLDGGDGNSYLPKISMYEDEVAVVWHDERDGEPDIYMSYSDNTGGDWSRDPVRVDTDGEGVASSLNPVVAMTENGMAVAWQDARLGGNDILVRITEDGGEEWTDEVRMDTDAGGESQSLDPVLLWEDDRIVVGWKDYRYDGRGEGSNDLLYNFSEDNGGTWNRSDVRLNSSQEGITYALDLNLMLHEKDLMSVWIDGRSGASRVYFASYALGDGSVFVAAEE